MVAGGHKEYCSMADLYENKCEDTTQVVVFRTIPEYKMNYYKILLTISLIILCSVIEAATFNRRDFNLKGDIYAIGVKEYSFFMEFGVLKKGTIKNETYTYFFQNGNVFIDSLHNTKFYKRYNYDAHNNVIEEMRIVVGGKKRKVGNTEFSFNDTTSYYSYSYDYGSGGQIKEIKKFGKGLVQIQKIICTKTATEERLEYWNRNNIDKEIIITTTSRITKHYTDLNDYKSPTNTIIETLNKRGLTIKETVKAIGGMVNSETLFSYDEHDNVINKTNKIRNAWGEGENIEFTYRYDYDNKGNWIRRLEYKNGELVSWIERIIGYASSPSDYTQILEKDKQLIKQTEKILLEEQHYRDSLQIREKKEAEKQKQYEDSLLVRKQLNEELDAIIERELLQKHITASYDNNSASYGMKLYGFNNKIRDCNVSGTTIEFLEKKGLLCFRAIMHEYRVCSYQWGWDVSHDVNQIIGIWYSNDLSNLLLYIPEAKKKGYIYYPMIVALHKNSDNYIAYEIEKDAFGKLNKKFEDTSVS